VRLSGNVDYITKPIKREIVFGILEKLVFGYLNL